MQACQALMGEAHRQAPGRGPDQALARVLGRAAITAEEQPRAAGRPKAEAFWAEDGAGRMILVTRRVLALQDFPSYWRSCFQLES